MKDQDNLIGQSVGNYVLDRPLKRGGMGAVYVAKHPALGREAAVKFLEAELGTDELRKRFLDEARITASLQHRNIIDIFDFGSLEERFYYVMELLVGQDLGEELSEGGRVPLPTTLEYLTQICSGLAAAHQAGIVHRDLKPANIFILDGHPLTVKLMDFGVAKVLATESSETNYGQLLGTPAYMAPEQAMGDLSKISRQTDLYSLGVIAYEMLAGRRPFEQTAPMMLLVAHIHEPPPPLAETAPHIPKPLAEIVDQCLAKDPKDRPESATWVEQRLREFVSESSEAPDSNSIPPKHDVPPVAGPDTILSRDPTPTEGAPTRKGEARKTTPISLAPPYSLTQRPPISVTQRPPLDATERPPTSVTQRPPLDATERPPISVTQRPPTTMADSKLARLDEDRLVPEPPQPAVAPPPKEPPNLAEMTLVSEGPGLPPRIRFQDLPTRTLTRDGPPPQRREITSPVEQPSVNNARTKFANDLPDPATTRRSTPPLEKPAAPPPQDATVTCGRTHVVIPSPAPANEVDLPPELASPPLQATPTEEPYLRDVSRSLSPDEDDGQCDEAPPSSTSSAPTSSDAKSSLTLDDGDRNILKKLLQRMRRKGDLPAFIANVGDVNKKADFEGKYSANQLSDAILKDHALTAKLLRVVNSTYVQRFGGKIFSVQQAIVILGFEQVRSIALSIAVFDKGKAGLNSARVADSSVHSLVAGELARELSQLAGVKDAEQATISSMFRPLGRHLTIVYLPDQYDKVLERADKDGISLERAAERELGLSFEKLGLGMAELWHLPAQLLESMRAPPSSSTKLVTDDQRVAALARLSNELCELVASGIDGPDDPKLKNLLQRHGNLVTLSPEEVPKLLSRVEDSFRTRYAALLGSKSCGSRFLEKLPAISPQALATRKAREKAAKEKRASRAAKLVVAKTERTGRQAKAGKGRAVQPVLLGRSQESTQKAEKNRAVAETVRQEAPPPSTNSLELQAIKNAVKAKSEQSLSMAIKAVARRLGLPRVVVLKPDPSNTELRASAAIGEDADALAEALRFELTPYRANGDIFSRAFHSRKDVFVKDSYSKKHSTQVPTRYFEALGSPAFALIVCQDGNAPPTLLLGDVSDPEELPSRAELSAIGELKKLIAQAA